MLVLNEQSLNGFNVILFHLTWHRGGKIDYINHFLMTDSMVVLGVVNLVLLKQKSIYIVQKLVWFPNG